jgi:hypothetical protein
MSTLTTAVFSLLADDEAVIVQDFSKTTVFRNTGKQLLKTVLRFDQTDLVLSKPEVVTSPQVDPEAVWFTISDMLKKVRDRRTYHLMGWADAVDEIVAIESRSAYRYDDDDRAADIRMERMC